MKDRAPVLEVFSSLQGEGPRLGERQIFVRFGGCNLCCDYCDEPGSIPLGAGALWDEARLQAEIEALQRLRPHSVISWTGGEPLLHEDFLGRMMDWAHLSGFSNYLETNGTLPAVLRELAGKADIISMDVKLPSATGQDCWKAHEEFLAVAPEKTFVKVVLTSGSTPEEWTRVVRLMAKAAPRSPLILQPATTVPSTREAGAKVLPIPPERAVAFLKEARAELKDVRLIPQWHPIWGMP